MSPGFAHGLSENVAADGTHGGCYYFSVALYDELRSVVNALDQAGVDYALVGGLAVAVWARRGRPGTSICWCEAKIWQRR